LDDSLIGGQMNLQIKMMNN